MFVSITNTEGVMAISMISRSCGGHIGILFWKLWGGLGPLPPLVTPMAIESKCMSLSQIQKELWSFEWFNEVAAAILDFRKCHWTKFCKPSGKCCLRPLWTNINWQKKSVQQFHLKCDFLLTITLYRLPPGRPVHSDTNSASLGSILAMQQLNAMTNHSHFQHCL